MLGDHHLTANIIWRQMLKVFFLAWQSLLGIRTIAIWPGRPRGSQELLLWKDGWMAGKKILLQRGQHQVIVTEYIRISFNSAENPCFGKVDLASLRHWFNWFSWPSLLHSEPKSAAPARRITLPPSVLFGCQTTTKAYRENTQSQPQPSKLNGS